MIPPSKTPGIGTLPAISSKRQHEQSLNSLVTKKRKIVCSETDGALESPAVVALLDVYSDFSGVSTDATKDYQFNPTLNPNLDDGDTWSLRCDKSYQQWKSSILRSQGLEALAIGRKANLTLVARPIIAYTTTATPPNARQLAGQMTAHQTTTTCPESPPAAGLPPSHQSNTSPPIPSLTLQPLAMVITGPNKALFPPSEQIKPLMKPQ